MATIRENIELLSRMLTLSGTSKINAERFRQAKFDKPEAVKAFWILLYELLHYKKYDQFPRQDAIPSMSDIIVIAKHELHLSGYRSPAFFTSSPNSKHSSRQLLLALGWLLAKFEIIDSMMVNTSYAIDDFYKNEIHKNAKECIKSNPSQINLDKDLKSYAKYLLWVNGKLQLTLRGLYAVNVEKQVLSHHVQEATQGVSLLSSLPHLTVPETYLLRHPKLQSKCYEYIEAENTRLQVMLKWKENEDIFWKWMESVADAHLKEDCDKQRDENGLGLEDFSMTTNMKSYQLIDLHSDLGALLNNCQGKVDWLDKISQKKIAHVAKKQVIEYVLRGIDMDVTDTLNAYPRHTDTKESQTTSPQFVLRKKTTHPPTVANASRDSLRDIDEEIKALQQIRDECQTELDLLRSKHRDTVSDLAQNMNNVVCIPPMAKK